MQIGYFSQSYERLNPEQTLLENFVVEYGFTEEHTRSMLGGMLFHGDDVFKKIGELSGGQKARLVLLKLVLDGANCLVLDEPTNHLDIMAREAVEAALEAFDGTVLVVSHDRYFVNEVADRIWEIEDLEVKDYKATTIFTSKKSRKRLLLWRRHRRKRKRLRPMRRHRLKSSNSRLLLRRRKRKSRRIKSAVTVLMRLRDCCPR